MLKSAIASAAVIGSLLGASYVESGAAKGSTPAPPVRPLWSMTPCAQEDSVNCFWDAHERGNGVGHSFLVRKFKNRTCYMYTDETFAEHHDGCFKS